MVMYDMMREDEEFGGPVMAMNANFRAKGAVMEAMPMAAPAPAVAQAGAGAVPETKKSANDAVKSDSKTESETVSKADQAAERVNFKETQYFTKFIKTSNGKSSGSFKLTDLITQFQITVDAVSSVGVYGALTTTFNSNKPFYIESSIPLFLTNSDIITVPLILTNNNPTPVSVKLDLSSTCLNSELSTSLSQSDVTVAAHSTKSVDMVLSAKQQTKDKFTVTVTAN